MLSMLWDNHICLANLLTELVRPVCDGHRALIKTTLLAYGNLLTVTIEWPNFVCTGHMRNKRHEESIQERPRVAASDPKLMIPSAQHTLPEKMHGAANVAMLPIAARSHQASNFESFVKSGMTKMLTKQSSKCLCPQQLKCDQRSKHLHKLIVSPAHFELWHPLLQISPLLYRDFSKFSRWLAVLTATSTLWWWWPAACNLASCSSRTSWGSKKGEQGWSQWIIKLSYQHSKPLREWDYALK